MADFWKYVKDFYDVSVDWSGQQVLPIGAKSLTTLTVTIKDDLGADVTGVMLVSSGVDGLVSYAQVKLGTKGILYTVIFRQQFDNWKNLERYVTLLIMDPRTKQLPNPFKFPNDRFDIPIQWEGRLPRGAVSLGAVEVRAYDENDVDESLDYVAGALALGTFSIGQIFGGVGGENRLLEFAQTFDNGRVLHEYVNLTVKVPPV